MEETAVLRVPRTDDGEGYVLVHVTMGGSKGQGFKLDATDGSDPFAVTRMYSRIFINIPGPSIATPF